MNLFIDRSTGETFDIVLIRDGEKVYLEDYHMVPVEYELDGETQIKYGFYFGEPESGFGAYLKYSWYQALDYVRLVRLSLVDLISGRFSVSDLSGPVGIVSLMNDVGQSAETVSDGFTNIMSLGAFIAINIAVMNMLPIPALDGGRVLFMALTWVIEKISRRKLNPKYEGYVHAAGLMLLLALMVVVMFNDIVRIVTSI